MRVIELAGAAGAAAALFLGAAKAAPLSARSTPASQQAAGVVNVARGELAVHGYDVVGYFTAGVAAPGRPEFEHRWNRVVWRFASATHRDEFARNPQRYAPQFGGYCAWAVSRGYTADVDPEAWRIVDGKLYLNYSKRVQRMWEQDVRGNITKGEANWPGVVNR